MCHLNGAHVNNEEAAAFLLKQRKPTSNTGVEDVLLAGVICNRLLLQDNMNGVYVAPPQTQAGQMGMSL